MLNELQTEGPPSSSEVPQSGETVNSQVEALPKHQYCVFRSGRERYCLTVSEVEVVVEWPVLTRMPLARLFLKGVFNLRGVIIPVLDIAYQEDRRSDAPPTHLEHFHK